MVLARCNQTIKLFLEMPIIKIFLTCACLSYRIRESQAEEKELFGSKEEGELAATKKKLCIMGILNAVEDWKKALEKDHKGKYTYFLMIYKAVLRPDQVSLNMEAKNLIDLFGPTEKDDTVSNFNQISTEYQDLLSRFSPGKSNVDRETLESSISPLYEKSKVFQSKMKGLVSMIHFIKNCLRYTWR